MEKLTKSHLREVGNEQVSQRILQWTDGNESCDQSDPNTSIHSPSKSSTDGYETSIDSFYTASEGGSEESAATIGRSAIPEPATSDVLIDTPQQETFEDASETVNPHPYLAINLDFAREAIYIYEMMKEGVIDDEWNSKSCLLTRTLIHDRPVSSSGRLGWRCDVNYDPDGVYTGAVVVLFMPDSDFVKKIKQGEVVFDQSTDMKPVSVLMQTIDPDFSGLETRLAGRVLAWKVCGSGDCVWMNRQGHSIHLGDPKVIPNIIHLLNGCHLILQISHLAFKIIIPHMYPESLVALYLGLPYTSNRNDAGRDVTGEVDVLNEGVLSMLSNFVELAEPVDGEGEDIGLAPRSTSIEVAGKSETSVSLTGRPSGPGILTTLGMQIQLVESNHQMKLRRPNRDQMALHFELKDLLNSDTQNTATLQTIGD
ncbi:uncharacterized protein FOBCDRAFT_245433 [Fusarium oxysporum Fo47]|uniref:uncharacterized protein n=1 Tax=Fusarium oxysporum Fo47 TaxID=660027 RepID=UPI002869926F|nr:uncharacterized protein FOBCDRAFT_245433 [Fusarium oxysporum Fo47]QKD62076.2 hypothetical protein FOBCDRAFT_245433 [Fusarium oxysporum Fo47]